MEEDQGRVRKKVEACQHNFARCLSDATLHGIDWIEDRQGEFNMWVASLKAASIGKASLDYRVRNDPELRETICDLVSGLSEALEKLPRLAHPQSKTSSGVVLLESGDDTESIYSAFSSSGADTESLPSIAKGDAPFSEQMLNVKTILRQLVRISNAIRRSGTKSRFRKADESLKNKKFDDFMKHLTIVTLRGSIEIMEEKNFSVDDYQRLLTDPERLTEVQQRLIRGNIVRRNRIMYARESMKPQITNIGKPADTSAQMIKLPPTLMEHVAWQQEQHYQPVHIVSGVVAQAPSMMANSVTRTATDVGSQFDLQQAIMPQRSATSVVTRVTRAGIAQDYPNCPKPKSGSEDLLQCPYCCEILPVEYSKSQSRWRGHVSQDILPYMCFYEHCEAAEDMYLTSDDLLKHALTQHSITCWICEFCASRSDIDHPPSFQSLEDWNTHMKFEHDGALPASQLPSLARVSQRRMLLPQACPLCGYATDDLRDTLDEHIVWHLHAFSLISLPWVTSESEKDSTDAKPSIISVSNDESDSFDVRVGLMDVDFIDPYSVIRAIEEVRTALNSSFSAIEELLSAIKWHDGTDQRQRLRLILSQLDIRRLKLHVTQLQKQHSEAMERGSFIALPGSSTRKGKYGKVGMMLDYTSDRSSTFAEAEDQLQELLATHAMRLVPILRHPVPSWSTHTPNNSFDLYCAKARHITNATINKSSKSIYKQLRQEWQNLADKQKDAVRAQLRSKKKDFEEYRLNFLADIETMLQDEISAIESIQSGSMRPGMTSRKITDQRMNTSMPATTESSFIGKKSRHLIHPAVQAIVGEIVHAEIARFLLKTSPQIKS